MPHNAYIISACVLTSVATILTISRFVLRRLKHEFFKPDDYAMVLAMALYWVYTAGYLVMASEEAPIEEWWLTVRSRRKGLALRSRLRRT